MKLSDAEWKVMQVVWRQSEVAARDVYDALKDRTDWAYTTVKTMLTRLAEKGAVSRTKRGNVSVFKPVITRAEARRADLLGLAERAFDGAFGPMLQFLLEDERLSDRDKQRLRDVLDEMERENPQQEENQA